MTSQSNAVRFLVPRPEQPLKPLFVFLPGMDGSGTLLRSQLDALALHFDVRCLSISPEDNTGWRRLTQQVAQLIRGEIIKGEIIQGEIIQSETSRAAQKKRQQPKPPLPSGLRRSVYLCGESFGGCLAMQVLTHSPELFDRVILVNPASSFRRLPWMQIGQMITHRLPNTVYQYGALGLVPFLIDPFRVAQHERKALEKAMGTVPPKTASWRMSLLSGFEVERLPLERMAHPVLLIAGGSDRLLPSKREVRSLLHRFPNAQQHLLPKSGHACLLEKDVSLHKIMLLHGFIPAERARLAALAPNKQAG